MQKQKVIMKIESYSSKDGTLLLSIEDWSVRTAIKSLVELCEKKHGNYIKLEMSPPYPARSTGKNSQNNLIWKLITAISESTGNDLEDVEEWVKLKAVRRGYPTKTNPLTGQIKPLSMTEIDTVEAGYLIEELYQLCAEMGINTEV